MQSLRNELTALEMQFAELTERDLVVAEDTHSFLMCDGVVLHGPEEAVVYAGILVRSVVNQVRDAYGVARV